jgi:transposase InsO family protein
MDYDDKTEVALWRFAVLGPLVSSELRHGDQRRYLREAADSVWRRWDGRRVKLSERSIERWLYAYRRGGFDALRPAGRSDTGTCRGIRPKLSERIVLLKKQNMRRSVRRIIRILERLGEARRGELKRSTVHRLLAAHGISHLEVRGTEGSERRAFRPEHAGQLWMGDVAHGPHVLAPDGRLRKAYLHVFIDAAVRFVVGAEFRLGEKAIDHQVVLKKAVRRHGLPNVLYLDLGAAQTAESLKLICAELGVRLLHCRARDPEAKAGVERFFRTARAEVLDELPDGPITLAELNAGLWAWLSVEYHAREHGGTKQRPMTHWLSEAERLRPAPAGKALDTVFLHRCKRTVRKDTTVRFGGRILEVRPELCGQVVELRHDPEKPKALPQVFVDGDFYCDTVELDLVRNSSRKRRRREPAPPLPDETADVDALKLIQDEHARTTAAPRTGREVA